MPKGYIVFVGSVRPLRLSVRPSFPLTFYIKVLLRSFLTAYNSVATDQKVFIFGMGVPRRVLFHSTSMFPWVMPQGGARGQNLGHPNEVVFLNSYNINFKAYIICLDLDCS